MFSIRKASIHDIPIIQKIADDTWYISYADMISPEQIKYMLDSFYSTQMLQAQMAQSNHQFYIISLDNNDIGFAACESNIQGKAGYYFLHKLYILPAFQKSGAGKFLINYIIEKGKVDNQNIFSLKVNRNNKAVQFYLKMGIEIQESVDIDIGAGFFMNDYVMTKKI